jgi:hypothetical protein
MYVIIKKIVNKDSGRVLPVILLNGKDEIWEFESETEAEAFRVLFEKNSDSGYNYELKKI